MKILGSLKHAVEGFWWALRNELNFKIHVAATIVVVLMAFQFKCSSTEWMILLLCIAAVLFAELINTSIELLCNKLSPEKSAAIKHVKDCAAAAVTLLALAAAIIGLIIFYPKIL